MRRARRLSCAANQLAIGSSSKARAITAVSFARSAFVTLRTVTWSGSRVRSRGSACVMVRLRAEKPTPRAQVSGERGVQHIRNDLLQHRIVGEAAAEADRAYRKHPAACRCLVVRHVRAEPTRV